jgi:tRNA-2-methylthio-N6-dimethylallyladenosine synthase
MLTYHVTAYGCQMSVHDAEGLAGLLHQEGYLPAGGEDSADIVLLNTCAVRHRPERKVAAKLGSLGRRKREGTLSVLGICGCMAQEHGGVLLTRFPELDFVCGTGNLTRVPELVRAALARGRTVSLDFGGDVGAQIPRRHASSHKAFVDIIYGCTNYCSYCIVPQVRGPERSRPMDEIIDEVTRLADAGWVEVTLLGQNVNAYGRDLGGAPAFARLLERVAGTEGIRRVRFTTSHPKDLSDDILDVMAGSGPVCEHLHLPVQAGDDEILARMNRGYTRDRYLRLAERARERVPGLSLTTDIIVGFPGETEEQYLRALSLVEEVRFDSAFTFAYVPRPGTAAAGVAETIGQREKTDRLDRLASLQKEISRACNEPLVGREHEVLVDGPSHEDPARMCGRTRTNKLAIFPASSLARPGRFVTVRATGAKLWGFEGELVGVSPEPPEDSAPPTPKLHAKAGRLAGSPGQ